MDDWRDGRIKVGLLDGTNGFAISSSARIGTVASAGDLNADSIDDFMVSAGGMVYVVFGREAGFGPILALADLNGVNGFAILPARANDGNGSAIADAGDVNGDGITDILIGAPGADLDGQFNLGRSFVLYGRSTGFAAQFDLAHIDGSNGFSLVGRGNHEFSGASLAGAGDFNADGRRFPD